MPKTGKEVKSSHFRNHNVVFGSVNNKHPKAVYINVSAWAEPLNEVDGGYTRAIKNIHKKTRQSLYDTFIKDSNSIFVSDRTIVDLDIRESGIRLGKRSFMNCEITLFVNVEIPINSDYMTDILTQISETIIYNVFDKDKTFKFHKKKK